MKLSHSAAATAALLPRHPIVFEHSGHSEFSRPVLLYWTASVLAMSYHYVLQVGDITTSSSHFYSNTPWYLGIIKAELWLVFLLWCIYRALQTGVHEITRYRFIILVSVAAAVVPLLINAARVMAEGSVSGEDARAWLNVWAHIVPCLLLSSVVEPEQVKGSIQHFAEYCFWPCLAFWLLTVVLYFGVGRLPGSSWPGRPRFGGVLDDPNGYAALSALFAALAVSLKGRWWRIRLILSLLMLLGTQSITGIGLALLMGSFALLWSLLQRLNHVVKLTSWVLIAAVAATIVLVTPLGTRLLSAGQTIWEYKRSSAGLHVGYFTQVPEQLQDANRPERWLFGTSVPPHYKTNYRDLSENFYFTVLLGFGLPGMLLVIAAVCTFLSSAWKAHLAWSRGLLCWALALSICSVGVPYLDIYPINALFWTLLALTAISGSVSYQSALLQTEV